MRSMRSREWLSDERPAPDHVDLSSEQGNDPLLTEAPATVMDDEDEVFDLGFIVDDRDDRRDTLLASWQRLDSLDSDEALESGESVPLPREAIYLKREGVPRSEYPTDAHVNTVAAEMQEEEFAADNDLESDPDDPARADDARRDDADLARLADDGDALAADDPAEIRPRRPSDPSPPEEPDADEPRADAAVG